MQKCLRNVSVEGRDDVQRIILGQKDEEGDDKQCRSEGEGTRQGQSSSGDHHYIGVLDTVLCCCLYNLALNMCANVFAYQSVGNSP